MEIEAEAASERKLQGIQVVGAWKVKRRHPHTVPQKVKKSFAPRFHAGSRKARIEMYRAYGAFLGEYREATDRLKKGHRNVVFPEGCFPPGLPYVGPTGLPPKPE